MTEQQNNNNTGTKILKKGKQSNLKENNCECCWPAQESEAVPRQERHVAAHQQQAGGLGHRTEGLPPPRIQEQ